MKILHIHKYFHERDGAGRYMLSLMRSQEAHGHATAVLAMHDSRNLPSPWARYFVSTLDTHAPGRGFVALRQTGRALWSFEAARNMRALLRTFQPDIVHTHNIMTHLSPSVLAECRRADVPVVMTVHDYALVSANYALWNGDRPLAPGKNSFDRIVRSRFVKGSLLATAALEAITRLHRTFGLVDRYVDRYVTLSHFVKDVMIAAGYGAEKIAVVPPGVDAGRGKGKEERRTRALFVGRLEEYKGPQVFVDAMRKLRNIPARIVGDGPSRTSLIARAKGVRNLAFDGFLSGDALEAAYTSARVLVVPSLWHEPFGLVALEAMARGIPVIVSDRGGLPEIVRPSTGSGPSGGLVVPAGDPDALAAAIRLFFDDSEWAEEMAKKACERVEAFGGPDAHFGRIQAVYEACG